MSIFSKLFGGGQERGGASAPSKAKSEAYNGFRIFPEPINEGGQYRVAARIEMEVDGVTKTHTLIRADTLADHGGAVTASINKAKQVIDEQGARIFD